MPYCQNCGKKIKSDEDFCPYCGKKTKVVVEKVVTKEKIVEKPVKEKEIIIKQEGKKEYSDFKIFLMYFFGIIVLLIGLVLLFAGCPAIMISAGTTNKPSILWFLIAPFVVLILGVWLIFKAKRMSR